MSFLYNFVTMKKIRKAVIPVAGNGTRFLPFTKTVPKEMLPIINKPTIQYIVDEAVASGIEEIIFITSSNKTALVDYFDRNWELEKNLENKGDKQIQLEDIKKPSKQAKYVYIRQYEALGLGHAVSLAKDLVGDEPFALLLGDDVIHHDDTIEPALKQMIDVYEKTNGKSVLGVQEVPHESVSSYGVISPSQDLGNKSTLIDGVVEKPEKDKAPSNKAIVGRYILTPKIFKYLDEKNVDPNTKEIQITDSILKLVNDEGVTAKTLDGIRYDMGSTKGFLEAQIDYALRNPELSKHVKEIIKRKNN